VKIQHEITQSGSGALTVAELQDLASALAPQAPADAAVWLNTRDSQREGTYWNLRVVWESDSRVG
jgi:hypothetical protein